MSPVPKRKRGPLLRRIRREELRAGNSAASYAAAYAPYAIKRAFVESNYQAALSGLARAILGDEKGYCAKCQRNGDPAPWALRCWLEAAGVVGAMGQVVVNMYQEISARAGVAIRDEEHLAELAAGGAKLEALEEEAAANLEHHRDNAMRVLKQVLDKHPEWREGVVAELS